MADNRLVRGHGTSKLEAANQMDLFLNSESPQVQELILHQRLRQEILKSGGTKTRYVDSELHFRNNQLNNNSPNWRPTSELARSNSSTNQQQQQQHILNRNNNLNQSNCNNIKNIRSSSNLIRSTGSERDLRLLGDLASSLKTNNNNNINHHHHNNSNNNISNIKNNHDHLATSSTINDFRQLINRSKKSNDQACGGCHIREMNQNLTTMYKLVQEQNDQMSRLKAKCLRSYFEKLHSSNATSK